MLTAVWEPDSDAAAQVLRAVGQDVPDDLERWAFLRIENDGKRCGYAWYGWMNGTDMGIHIFIDPDVRGRWSRALLRALHWFPTLLGAKRLVANYPNDKAAALARSAGWQREPDGKWSIALPCAWSC